MAVTLPTGPLPVVVSGRLSGVPIASVPGASLTSSRFYYNNYCNTEIAPAPARRRGLPASIS